MSSKMATAQKSPETSCEDMVDLCGFSSAIFDKQLSSGLLGCFLSWGGSLH